MKLNSVHTGVNMMLSFLNMSYSGSRNIFLSVVINLLSLWADTQSAKYSRSRLLHEGEHQQPKQPFWSFDPVGIIFSICFCLCQGLLTLQTVPFHYLHAVSPLQVNVDTSCQLCWFCAMSNQAEKLKYESITVALGGSTEAQGTSKH